MQTIPKENAQLAFLPGREPAAFIRSGESVRFECSDCYGEQLAYDGFPYEKMDMRRNNPATGPLYIEEAQPGDLLKITIEKIEIASEGSMCARTGAGIYEIEGCHCRRFHIENGEICFDHGIRIPIKPMIGVIGTASPEKLPTTWPGEHGGNMDIRDLGEGAVLVLPVFEKGALLSVGDLHAVQGDGETVVCALEMNGFVTLKAEVLKGRGDLPTPFILTKDAYLTTGAAETLDEAGKIAAQKMHRFLQAHSPLNDAQSGMLLSLAGNLRISQVVNPRKGCIMELKRGLAKEDFRL